MALTSAEKMAKHRRYMRQWYQEGLKTGNPAVVRFKEHQRQADRARYAAMSPEQKQIHLNRIRNLRFKRHFGIALDQYRTMLAEQGGVCAICRRVERATWHGHVRMLAVDHDHRTKRVRGLLCQQCNLALGWLEARPDLRQRMLDYLTPLSSP